MIRVGHAVVQHNIAQHTTTHHSAAQRSAQAPTAIRWNGSIAFAAQYTGQKTHHPGVDPSDGMRCAQINMRSNCPDCTTKHELTKRVLTPALLLVTLSPALLAHHATDTALDECEGKCPGSCTQDPLSTLWHCPCSPGTQFFATNGATKGDCMGESQWHSETAVEPQSVTAQSWQQGASWCAPALKAVQEPCACAEREPTQQHGPGPSLSLCLFIRLATLCCEARMHSSGLS